MGKRTTIIALLALGAASFFWARSLEKFRCFEASLKTENGVRTKAVVVLPKTKGPFPVVVYLHGAGGDAVHDGEQLRQFAELGLGSVSLDYCQTNQEIFEAQFTALCAYVSQQSWVRSNSVAWVGYSLGAQSMLSFLLNHPATQPELLARLSGGWVPELDGLPAEGSCFPLHCRTLLVHGEEDSLFPAIGTEKLASLLKKNGVPVDCKIIPELAHKYNDERSLIARLTAEYCKSVLSPGERLVESSQNGASDSRGMLVLGAILGLVFLAAFRKQAAVYLVTRNAPGSRGILLWWIAAVAVMLTVTDLSLRLAMRWTPVNHLSCAVAHTFLVSREQRDDFDYLAHLPSSARQPVSTLIHDAELADYNQALVSWRADRPVYLENVLSPEIIGGHMEEPGWRRIMWENLYPRIRHESDRIVAAKTIVRYLRERVSPVAKLDNPTSLAQSWKAGTIDRRGFERIYVAALRSVGIASRLGPDHAAELFVDGAWVKAPRPIAFSFLD